MKVWRVQWWVRLLAVVMSSSVALLAWRWQSRDPDGWNSVPVGERVRFAMLVVLLVPLVWAAFRSRVELAGGQVRVVNPWGSKTFPVSEVVCARLGNSGLEFVLARRPAVTVFAVQCAPALRGQVPMWVDVARTISGRDPYPPANLPIGWRAMRVLNYVGLLCGGLFAVLTVVYFLDGDHASGLLHVVAVVLSLIGFVIGVEKGRAMVRSN